METVQVSSFEEINLDFFEWNDMNIALKALYSINKEAKVMRDFASSCESHEEKEPYWVGLEYLYSLKEKAIEAFVANGFLTLCPQRHKLFESYEEEGCWMTADFFYNERSIYSFHSNLYWDDVSQYNDNCPEIGQISSKRTKSFFSIKEAINMINNYIK